MASAECTSGDLANPHSAFLIGNRNPLRGWRAAKRRGRGESGEGGVGAPAGLMFAFAAIIVLPSRRTKISCPARPPTKFPMVVGLLLRHAKLSLPVTLGSVSPSRNVTDSGHSER